MSNDVEAGKVCAILAYFFPIGLIWYFADEKMKKNTFAGFHVKQSLVLFIAAIIIEVVGSLIPLLGWFLILPLGSLLILIWWIVGLVNAISGKEKELFWIGKFGSKFDF